jgi:hypothetical protein
MNQTLKTVTVDDHDHTYFCTYVLSALYGASYGARFMCLRPTFKFTALTEGPFALNWRIIIKLRRALGTAFWLLCWPHPHPHLLVAAALAQSGYRAARHTVNKGSKAGFQVYSLVENWGRGARGVGVGVGAVCCMRITARFRIIICRALDTRD